MDFYTLDGNFIRDEVVDQFTSVVWTERYSSAGDVSLVVPASSTTIELLAPKTFLSLEGSKEVMLLETQSIDDGLLTVTGNSLLAFTSQRLIRSGTLHKNKQWFIPWLTPGGVIEYIVQEMLIDGIGTTGEVEDIGFDGPRQAIPNLVLGPIDTTGEGDGALVPFGPVYDAIQEIAETNQLGLSLYLGSASPEDYELVFTVYKGLDRSSDQEINPLVRFSPVTGSLDKIKELYSIAGMKNVAYAFAPSYSDTLDIQPVAAYSPIDGGLSSTGFDRRVLMLFVDDISEEDVGGDLLQLQVLLYQRALNALANNNYTKLVDGEVVPQSEYAYGVDYNLGDIVELEGSIAVQKARITEYIRSQDESGIREYPTIAIVQ